MLPNLIIAGYGKCGTTSLFRYLSHSRNVAVSKNKEANFMLRNNLDDISTLYDKNFSSQGLRIDASPSYIHDLEQLLYNISLIYNKECESKPTLLICVREPFGKVVSVYKAAKRSGILKKELNFSNFILNSLNGTKSCDGKWGDWLINDVLNSIYHEDFNLLLNNYKGNLLFLDSNSIAKKPFEIMTQILSLHGLTAEGYDNFEFVVQNQAVVPRSVRLHIGLVKLNGLLEPLFNRIPYLKQPLVSSYRKYFSIENEECFESKEFEEYIKTHINETKSAFDRASWVCEKPKWVSKYEK